MHHQWLEYGDFPTSLQEIQECPGGNEASSSSECTLYFGIIESGNELIGISVVIVPIALPNIVGRRTVSIKGIENLHMK